MRLVHAVFLTSAVCATGCVNVHRSSSRPGDKAIVDATGGVPDLILERHFTSVASQNRRPVTNISYFDLASCEPPQQLVKDVYSDEQLMAALTMARPQVLECLVDPSRRGPAEETHAVVDAIAQPGSGVEATVGGSNLTSSGQRCILEAVGRALSTLPPLPEGWPPVAAEVDFVHSRDTLPGVRTGVNDLSDGAGQIRLAMPSFCGCFDPWRASGPKEIEVLVNLRHPSPNEVQAQAVPQSLPPHGVILPPDLKGGDAQVASCLQGQLMKMSFPVPRLEVDIPFYFQFIDSRRDGPLPGLPAWLQHKQLEAVRARRFAELAMALGARSSAARNYDALVRRYEADNKSIKVDVLSRSCEGLLQTDDLWATAAQRKLEAEQLALPIAAQVDKQDLVSTQIAQSEHLLGSASEVKRIDERACPRKSWRWVPGRPARTPGARGHP